MVPGTIVYYDDVSVVKEEGGELKAHHEISAKYNVQWKRYHDSCWEVISIGGLEQAAAPTEAAASATAAGAEGGGSAKVAQDQEDWDTV